jgi:hypothetical protein
MGEYGSFTNAGGKISFIGWLAGANVTENNDFGIWSESVPNGPLVLDLREGQHAPGTPDGVVWAGFHQYSLPLTFSRSGSLALRLELAGPDVLPTNNTGVWSGVSPSQLHLVVREGDSAQGTEDGTRFSQFDLAGSTIDGRGIFFAFLSGIGLDPNRDRGIWAEGVDGALHLIARRGDSVQLPSGEVVQLTSIQFDPEYGVSVLGHVAFLGGLSNGLQAIFVSSVAAIPEPPVSSLVIAAITCIRLVRRRNKN